MSWLSRLKSGLSKTNYKLKNGIADIFLRRRLDKDSLAELEELLIQSDIGVKTAAKIIKDFGERKLDKEISPEDVRAELVEEITRLLKPVAVPLSINNSHHPHVIIVVGVNGNGKTTTIGKLAHNFIQNKHMVMLAAADTFRAAAVEQLAIWAKRTHCDLVTGEEGAEPASVAYKALEEAKTKKADILIIDSAGRLQNKSNLMAELQKIIKVIKKIDPEAPHSVIQVLDATTGQNAISQVEIFASMVNVTGLVITKLDGTAKGGIVVALADKFCLPIHAIGVGEGIEDLQAFRAEEFAENML